MLTGAQVFAQTTVNVNPNAYYGSVGDTIKVIIKINNVNSLHSASVKVRFNNSIVRFIGVYNSGGIFTGGWIDNQPLKAYVNDSVIVDQALQGYGFSVSGSDTLFQIRFKAIANGISYVRLSDNDFRDPYNNSISSSLDSGHIYIGGIVVNTKVFLQGPYNTLIGMMNTLLNYFGYLPCAQPYDSIPWIYDGNESVQPDFFSSHDNIVDWVLVELRTGTEPSTITGSKAAFILEDGSIVDYRDGISKVYFDGLQSGNYYIVIRHRNHLAVMSSSSVSLTNKSSIYDFTNSLSKYYGGDANLLTTGVYGMYGGDANRDGMITTADFNLFNPDNRQAKEGYLYTDFNLDGMVTTADFNIFNPNNRIAAASRVP
jgi:hypothetical protein